MLLSLLVAGCGGEAGATRKPTPHKQPAATPTDQAAPTSPVIATATAQATATASPSPSPRIHRTPRARHAPTSAVLQPARVIDATLRPFSVAAAGALTARVQTSGPVGRVEMYLGSGQPDAPSPTTLTLTRQATGIWTGGGTAPRAPGEYHYTVGLYVNGVRTVVDNDGWNIKVAGGSSSGSSATLPADIPLAPPFSYGNPTPAVFSAQGRSVNGYEVVSTTRTDVEPSTVSQWYTIHFPRAGWTVDPATVPSAGATSFTMVATSGNRVCVVEYAAYTVHIFYGAFG